MSAVCTYCRNYATHERNGEAVCDLLACEQQSDAEASYRRDVREQQEREQQEQERER